MTRAVGGTDGYSTIGMSLALSAKRFPDKLAISHPRGELTYRELDDDANYLASVLLKRGVRHGDHVALLMDNTIEHVVSIYATAKIGAIGVALGARWVEREIVQALKAFDCSFLISDDSMMERLGKSHQEEIRNGVFVFRTTDSLSGMFGTKYDAPSVTAPDVPVSDDDVFMLMLTSGTTGMPKGCIKTHRSYVHSCFSAALELGIDENSKELIVVPIYFNSGRISLLTQIFVGGSVFLRERFEPEEALQLIATQKITALALALPQCQQLLDFPRLDYYDKSSLRSLRKAGLPFQAQMTKDVIRRITPALFQGFGGTEFSSGTYLKPEDQLKKLGSAGRPVCGIDVELVDDKGAAVPYGQPGEVRLRGTSVVSGYYNNDEATRTSFIDGWYYSGDVGQFDREGYLFIVGRKKDLIKSGGINVAPREVEDVLLSFSEVADAAVIGIPDSKWGETIKAFVAFKKGHRLDQAELVSRCREMLASYKIPKQFEFVELIARNQLGKITSEFRKAAASAGDEKRG
jgi:fatty-acyl-CoA synthase